MSVRRATEIIWFVVGAAYDAHAWWAMIMAVLVLVILRLCEDD